MQLSDTAKSLKLGEYVHYKGGRYEVINIAHDELTGDEVVVYKALQRDMGLWVRKLSIFLEDVEVDGKKVPRFKYMGQNN